jgi:membrane carboxypeptidase/penicillin-binding protein
VPKINLAGGVFDAPHFVLNVRDWLDDKFGESAVRTGGYKVFTTLDYSKQKIAEAAITSRAMRVVARKKGLWFICLSVKVAKKNRRCQGTRKTAQVRPRGLYIFRGSPWPARGRG